MSNQAKGLLQRQVDKQAYIFYVKFMSFFGRPNSMPAGPSPEGGGVPPEYVSPFRFQIQEPQRIYENALYSRELRYASTAFGGQVPIADAYIKIDKTDKMSFQVRVKHLYRQGNDTIELTKYAQENQLSTTIKTYLGDEYDVAGNNVRRRINTSPDGKPIYEVIASLPSSTNSDYRYFPQDQITSPEQFEKNLNTCLKILQIYVTEFHKANKVPPPTYNLIITDSSTLPPSATDRQISSIEKQMKGEIDKERKRKEEENRGKIKDAFEGEDDKIIESLRQAIIVEETPDVTFEDVGGQQKAVDTVRSLATQLILPESYEQYGVPPPKGILFFGPPGTGKTLLARALARETSEGANTVVIRIKCSDLERKWFGDSEKLASGLFKIARTEAEAHGGHCIMYFDEAESVFPRRDEGEHSATRKMVGVMLQEIDGFEQGGGNITIIASTNNPNQLDPAFRNRMTTWVEVPLPDANGRKDIFQIHFNKYQQDASNTIFSSDIDMDTLAAKTEGLSGREIKDVIEETIRHVNEGRIRTAIIKDLRQTGIIPNEISDDQVINDEKWKREIWKRLKELKKSDFLQNLPITPISTQDVLSALDSSQKVRDVQRDVQKSQRRIGFQP